MFSEYFIDRPRFAGVISIIMILLGLLAIAVLPVSQYPEITPPQIVVSTTYPGASAQVVIDTVAVPGGKPDQRRGKHAVYDVKFQRRRQLQADDHL